MTPDESADVEEPTCESCGGPRPEGPPLCPHCEDLEAMAVSYGRPDPVREPPHGGTTR